MISIIFVPLIYRLIFYIPQNPSAFYCDHEVDIPNKRIFYDHSSQSQTCLIMQNGPHLPSAQSNLRFAYP